MYRQSKFKCHEFKTQTVAHKLLNHPDNIIVKLSQMIYRCALEMNNTNIKQSCAAQFQKTQHKTVQYHIRHTSAISLINRLKTFYSGILAVYWEQSISIVSRFIFTIDQMIGILTSRISPRINHSRDDEVSDGKYEKQSIVDNVTKADEFIQMRTSEINQTMNYIINRRKLFIVYITFDTSPTMSDNAVSNRVMLFG